VINKYTVTLFAILTGLATWIFYPALFLDQSLVHGDNLHHGYAILKFHSRVIHEGYSPFWTDLIYGGHAIFAESQGGLSNPFNYLVAWLLPPEFGHNFIHYLSMIALGIGTYGFSRTFKISSEPAIFAAIAASFSGLIIHTNTNMTAISAAACIPWALWMFERWITTPTSKNALCFGLAIAMQIFAGYPQFFHGTVLYMLVSLCTLPFNRDAYPLIKAYISTGLLAMLVCAGISAVQWIPLIELASLSSRNDGTELLYDIPFEVYMRGFISSINGATAEIYFPNVASIFVCTLASMILFLPTNFRLKGHIVASFLLLNLAFDDSSFLYRLVSQYNLIPGMSYFRLMFAYFYLPIISICVFAAYTLDWLSRNKIFNGELAIRKISMGITLLFWLYFAEKYHIDDVSTWHYIIWVTAIVAVLFANELNLNSKIPIALILLLLAETIALKITVPNFIDNKLLRSTPDSVKSMRKDIEDRGVKHIPMALSPLHLGISPHAKDITHRVRPDLEQLTASTNLIWDIPSFGGAFALQLSRRELIQSQIVDEVTGKSTQRPGLRLMDILSIGYITTRDTNLNESLVPAANNGKLGLLQKNAAAKSRIQTYDTVQTVSSPEEALVELQNSAEELLVIETADPILADEYDDQDTQYGILEQSATSYKVTSNSQADYWLFIADANYPGWKAEIDGVDAPVYTAQVLGKAVRVPKGQHHIRIWFDSMSHKMGGYISLLTATFLTLYLLAIIFRRRKVAV
jgi:hypothetical protein